MADYIRSDPPTLTLTTNAAYEAVQITVVNPTPTGSRPTVVSNQIWRKVHGSGNGWTLAATVGNNGTYTDLFLRPNTQYDYFARTDTYADSGPYLATTPPITGMWIYDPNNQAGTLRHFAYGTPSVETLGIDEALLQFVGRTYPVAETGVSESQNLALAVTVPFSDTDWSAQVEWFRTEKRARTTLLLRDGRGHAHAGYLAGDLVITPTRMGADVTVSFTRVDYTAQTTILPEAYYTSGNNNDGGNGIYGNGSQGNGY